MDFAARSVICKEIRNPEGIRGWFLRKNDIPLAENEGCLIMG